MINCQITELNMDIEMQDHSNKICSEPLSLVDNNMELPKSRPIPGQVKVATMVYLVAICSGLSSGYSAILLPQLRVNSSTIQIDDNIGSWLVSGYIFLTPVGCLMSGIIMQFWGRRLTTLFGIATGFVGWVLIATANSYQIMILGRALGGFGKGIVTPSVTFHLEEMADPKLRGSLSACILLKYSVGIMLMSMVGGNVSWEVSAGISAAISLLTFLGYFLLPESPVWLVRNDRISHAANVFNWLWGTGHNVEAQKELQELCLRIEDEKSHCNISSGWNLKQYLKPHVLKPFFIVYIFNILQIPCGTNLFIFYSVDIISNATTDETMNVNFINILTSSTRVIFMAASCLCLVWIGRRTISITSGVGSGIACVILGTAVYLQYDQAWLISTLVVLYVAFNTYGFFVLPPSMIGEILPSKIRCPVGAYIFVSNDIGMFVATKIFLSVNRSVGAHGLFWIFGSSSLFCALFLYLLLPETKGQSLVQLEQYFLQSNVLWITRHRTKTSVLTNSSNKRNMINK